MSSRKRFSVARVVEQNRDDCRRYSDLLTSVALGQFCCLSKFRVDTSQFRERLPVPWVWEIALADSAYAQRDTLIRDRIADVRMLPRAQADS